MTLDAEQQARLDRARAQAAKLNLPPQVAENLAIAMAALGCDHMEIGEDGIPIIPEGIVPK